MILLQTIGSVDMPGKGQRKMPAPRAYLAVIVAWSVLNILVDVGMERAARLIGWALVITGMIVGPFGQRVINLFNAVSPVTAITPQSSSAATSNIPSIASAPFHQNG